MAKGFNKRGKNVDDKAFEAMKKFLEAGLSIKQVCLVTGKSWGTVSRVSSHKTFEEYKDSLKPKSVTVVEGNTAGLQPVLDEHNSIVTRIKSVEFDQKLALEKLDLLYKLIQARKTW